MPRYIDADKLIPIFEEMIRSGDYCKDCIKDAISEVEQAPTLSPDDVRGVVHCHECSHADKDLPGAIYCTMWDAWGVQEDGFCYKGAKMKGVEDKS